MKLENKTPGQPTKPPSLISIVSNLPAKFANFKVEVRKVSKRFLHRLTHNPVTRFTTNLKDRCITAKKFVQALYGNISKKIKERPLLYFFGAFFFPITVPYIVGRAVETASRESVLREGGSVGTDEPLDPNTKWDLHPEAEKIMRKAVQPDSNYDDDAIHSVIIARTPEQRQADAEKKRRSGEDVDMNKVIFSEPGESSDHKQFPAFSGNKLARESIDETQEIIRKELEKNSGLSKNNRAGKSDDSDDI